MDFRRPYWGMAAMDSELKGGPAVLSRGFLSCRAAGRKKGPIYAHGAGAVECHRITLIRSAPWFSVAVVLAVGSLTASSRVSWQVNSLTIAPRTWAPEASSPRRRRTP